MMRFLFVSYIVFLTGCSSYESNSYVVTGTERPEYARGFEIQELKDSGYLLILLNPENPSDTLEVIEIGKNPKQKISCLSTTHVSMIDKLGRINLLKGAAFADRLHNPNAAEAYKQGNLINLSSDKDLDDEKVLGLKTDLLFVYPFGGTDYSGYRKAGITVVPVSEYMESHPLGRAEWIKVFGLLLGARDEADSIFNDIKSQYLALTKKIQDSVSFRPTVFSGFYDNGDWYAPAGNGFIARFYKDAGTQYIFSDSSNTGNLKIPFETLYHNVYDVDYWIKLFYESEQPTHKLIASEDPRLTNIKAFKQNHIIYCNTSENDYFGDAVMEPHIILADLIKCFHENLLPGYTNKYFKRLPDTIGF